MFRRANSVKCMHFLMKWIFLWCFVLIGERRLGNGFLTVQIFLRPRGTVDTNCLGCSVLLRLKGNHMLFTPQSLQTARGICSGVLIISAPEITYLPDQSVIEEDRWG